MTWLYIAAGIIMASSAIGIRLVIAIYIKCLIDRKYE